MTQQFFFILTVLVPARLSGRQTSLAAERRGSPVSMPLREICWPTHLPGEGAHTRNEGSGVPGDVVSFQGVWLSRAPGPPGSTISAWSKNRFSELL
jgi:hypothetical protein